MLFNESVIDNIRLGKPDASREEVEAAAKLEELGAVRHVRTERHYVALALDDRPHRLKVREHGLGVLLRQRGRRPRHNRRRDVDGAVVAPLGVEDVVLGGR